MAGVAGHLRQHLVILEQRNGDELAEQAGARRFQHVPRGFQREGFRLAEFDADHQPFSARVLHQLVLLHHPGEGVLDARAEPGGVLDQALLLDHLQRGDAGGHRQVVLGEGRAMHDGAVHPVENLVEDRLARQQRADGDMPAGERFRQQHHVRLDIPVLDSQEFACAAHAGLDFVGDQQRPVFAAEGCRIGQEGVVRNVHALALNGLEDEGRVLARGQRPLQLGDVVERDARAVRQQRLEAGAEILVVGQRQRAVGQAVIGVAHIQNAGAAGRAAREFDGGLDALRPRIGEERLLQIGHELHQLFGQQARQHRHVHLHEIRKVAVQNAGQRLAQGRVIAADREHAEAAQQIEIFLVLPVIEILPLAAAEADVEADRLQDADELFVQIAAVQCPSLGFPVRNHLRQVQLFTRHRSHFCFVVMASPMLIPSVRSFWPRVFSSTAPNDY